MRAIAFFLIVAWQFLGVAHGEEQPTYLDPASQLTDLFSLIRARLDVMESVAAWKWAHKTPILDSAREEAVLAATVAQAEALGIEAQTARRFFALQIRLARELQARAQQRWEKGATAPTAEDLASVLRPRLDALSGELLKAAYMVAPFVNDLTDSVDQQARATVARFGLGPSEAEELRTAILQLKLEPPDLMHIKASGVLRIGTTGDYAPFSLDAGGHLSGADVALAKALANDLGLRAIFIRTSWSSLMSDYAQNRFDVAMSGISVTPERSRDGAFSVPYHTGGKTAIARCEQSARFRDIDAIDREDVRVIVNPGGTNERFARERLHKAQLRVFPDNRRIFEEILAKRADVMITDDVEVELQARHKQGLCRTTRDVFTQATKAILIARDPQLLAVVNDWLSTKIRSGETRRVLESALLE